MGHWRTWHFRPLRQSPFCARILSSVFFPCLLVNIIAQYEEEMQDGL